MPPDNLAAQEKDYRPRKLSIRENLEIRKESLENHIKRLTFQLEDINKGLKLLDKNKDLESLVNIFQLGE